MLVTIVTVTVTVIMKREIAFKKSKVRRKTSTRPTRRGWVIPGVKHWDRDRVVCDVGWWFNT